MYYFLSVHIFHFKTGSSAQSSRDEGLEEVLFWNCCFAFVLCYHSWTLMAPFPEKYVYLNLLYICIYKYMKYNKQFQFGIRIGVTYLLGESEVRICYIFLSRNTTLTLVSIAVSYMYMLYLCTSEAQQFIRNIFLNNWMHIFLINSLTKHYPPYIALKLYNSNKILIIFVMRDRCFSVTSCLWYK